MKKYISLLLTILFANVAFAQSDVTKDRLKINQLLDGWHNAAARTDFDRYFDAVTENFSFVGTDATEHWDRRTFAEYAKPYFDKGKAWNFTSIERHIYFSPDRKTAWFDELLDTQMKICRGSGVVLRQNGVWKIAQYVLSMTVPNENVEAVIKVKSPIEDPLIEKIKNFK